MAHVVSRDDSNTWSNIGFGGEITQVISLEVNISQRIWNSGSTQTSCHIIGFMATALTMQSEWSLTTDTEEHTPEDGMSAIETSLKDPPGARVL